MLWTRVSQVVQCGHFLQHLKPLKVCCYVLCCFDVDRLNQALQDATHCHLCSVRLHCCLCSVRLHCCVTKSNVRKVMCFMKYIIFTKPGISAASGTEITHFTQKLNESFIPTTFLFIFSEFWIQTKCNFVASACCWRKFNFYQNSDIFTRSYCTFNIYILSISTFFLTLQVNYGENWCTVRILKWFPNTYKCFPRLLGTCSIC